jgi:hypothetical protein
MTPSGVPADLLEGIDAAELDIWRFVAELVDCPGEPIGDLPFTRDAQLSEGEVDAEQHRRAAKTLKQRGTFDARHSTSTLQTGA